MYKANGISQWLLEQHNAPPSRLRQRLRHMTPSHFMDMLKDAGEDDEEVMEVFRHYSKIEANEPGYVAAILESGLPFEEENPRNALLKQVFGLLASVYRPDFGGGAE